MGVEVREKIRSHRDLDVWKHGRALVKEIYQLTESFPKHQNYRLADQIQRAVVSVPSNIAEGHSRKMTRDYMRFVGIASGSLAEVETQLFLAYDLGYVSKEQIEPLLEEVNTLERMLNALYNALKRKLD